MSGLPDDLPGQIAFLLDEIAEIKRRDRNRKRTGKIAEIDLQSGKARVEFHERDGKKYLGPWMPWKEIAAGGIKTHIPPVKGEQVDVLSESGDLTDGVIDMSTPSNENPRPHDGPEAVITKGNSTLFIGDNVVRVITDAVIIEAQSVDLGGEGGQRVARIGDKVAVGTGSSAGLWPIVEGSAIVKAI